MVSRTILSRMRLPVPPHRHGDIYLMTEINFIISKVHSQVPIFVKYGTLQRVKKCLLEMQEERGNAND